MIDSLANIIKGKQFPPILLLFGEEDFLLEEAYGELIRAAVDKDSAAFNFDLLDGSETKQEQIVELASAFPMMAERRTVVVKHFDKLFQGRGSKAAAEKSPLARYIKAPAPSSFLLLLASIPSLNGISKAARGRKDSLDKKIRGAKFPFNLLLQHADWIEFRKLYEREVPSWVGKRFRSFGRELSPEASELLIAQIGFSLRELSNEIDKILIYVGDKKKISKDDIAGVIGASKTYNIFELQKAVGLNNATQAMEILNRMLHTSRQELVIISMLARYFTILWKLYEARGVSGSENELGRSVGVSPYFVSEYLVALQRYSLPRIEAALRSLSQADYLVKSTSEDPAVVLQKTLIGIMSS